MKEVLYETKKLKVSRILDNLEELGVKEVNKLKHEFDSICSRPEVEEKIKMLDDMERSLSDYNEKFKLISKINFLYNTIDGVNNMEESLECKEIAVSIISTYNKIEDKSSGLNLDRMCAAIYKTIKKEILYNKSCQILDMIKSDDLLCYHMDKYIRLDVQNILNSVNYNPIAPKVKTKIDEINMNGLGSHLVSYNLISLVAIFDDYASKEKEYESIIKSTKYGLSNNFDRYNYDYILERIEKNDKTLNSLDEKWENKSNDEADIFFKFMMSILVFGGVAFAIPVVTKDISNVDVYKTTTESYIDGGKVEVSEDYQTKNSREISRTLEVGEGIKHDRNGKAYRSLKVYDLTDIVLDSIEEYARLDLESYDIRPNDDIHALYDVTLMDEGDKRVTIVTQDYSNSNIVYSSTKHALISCICYVLEAICLVLPFSPLKTTMKLIKYKKEYNEDNENYNEVLKQLLEDLKLLNEVIKDNNLLKEKFDEVKDDINSIYGVNNKDLTYIESMFKKTDEYYEKVKVLNKNWNKN